MIPNPKASLHDTEPPIQYQAFILLRSTTYILPSDAVVLPKSSQSFCISPLNNQCPLSSLHTFHHSNTITFPQPQPKSPQLHCSPAPCCCHHHPPSLAHIPMFSKARSAKHCWPMHTPESRLPVTRTPAPDSRCGTLNCVYSSRCTPSSSPNRATHTQ